jgi:Trk-type K+ transport system membrane component
VLSIIVLSLFFILSAFMLLMIFEPARHPAHLLFECISAFSTTGLSIADTATLGTPSRVVVLILMFVGRIGPVVLLSGLLLTKTSDLYRLPVEEIKIN